MRDDFLVNHLIWINEMHNASTNKHNTRYSINTWSINVHLSKS